MTGKDGLMSEQEMQPTVGQNDEASAETIFAIETPVKSHLIEGAGLVYIHGLSCLEKAQWQKECRDGKGQVNIEMVEPLMFQMCVRNSKGQHVFKREQILKIKEKASSIIGPVCDICMNLSGMGRLADEEILKNFAPIGTEDS
jgi:hypothetical protein